MHLEILTNRAVGYGYIKLSTSFSRYSPLNPDKLFSFKLSLANLYRIEIVLNTGQLITINVPCHLDNVQRPGNIIGNCPRRSAHVPVAVCNEWLLVIALKVILMLVFSLPFVYIRILYRSTMHLICMQNIA